jgi:hypothetical protein
MYKNQQTMHSIKNCISNKEIGTKTPATPPCSRFFRKFEEYISKIMKKAPIDVLTLSISAKNLFYCKLQKLISNKNVSFLSQYTATNWFFL